MDNNCLRGSGLFNHNQKSNVLIVTCLNQKWFSLGFEMITSNYYSVSVVYNYIILLIPQIEEYKQYNAT